MLGASDRLRLLFAWALTVVSGLLELATMGLVFAFIGVLTSPAALAQAASRWRLPAPSSTDEVSLGLVLGGAVLTLYVLKDAVLFAAEGWLLHVLSSLGRAYAELLFADYINGPYEQHVQYGVERLRRSVASNALATFHEYALAAMRACCDATIVTMIGGALLLVNWRLTAGAAFLFGLVALAYARASHRYAQRLGQERQAALTDTNRWLAEGLGGLKELRILGRQRTLVQRLRRSLATQSSRTRRIRLLELAPRMLNETTFIFGVIAAVTYYLLSGRTLAQALPALALFAAGGMRSVAALARLSGSLQAMRVHSTAAADAYAEFARFHGAGGKLRLALHAHEGRGRSEGQRGPFKRSLVCAGLTFAYRDQERGERRAGDVELVMHQGRGIAATRAGHESVPPSAPPAINDVSLSITRGSFVGLVGPSGGGKSTLLGLLLGLLEPSRGTIAVDGHSIHDDLSWWHRQLALVPQAAYMAPETVRDNVAFGVPREEIDEARLWRALAQAQVAEFIASLPLGLDTHMREEAAAFSGGERQRIALARALYADRPVLILDEATSALDNATQSAVRDSILSLRGEKTIIWVAHQLSTVRACDQIYFIAAGRVAASGDFATLLAEFAPFRRMVELE